MDMRDTRMETSIQGTSRLAKLMDRAIILGITQGRYMMENGIEDTDMGTASGKVSKAIVTSESGEMERLQAMECSPGAMETSTKENGT